MDNGDEWEDWDAADAGGSDADVPKQAAHTASPRATTAAATTAQPVAALQTPTERIAAPATADTRDRSADAPESDAIDADSDPWTWDLNCMERDVRALPPRAKEAASAALASGTNDDANDPALEHIMHVADVAANAIDVGRTRVVTLEALALVAKLHLLSLRCAFDCELSQNAAAQQIPLIIERLHSIAGDWVITEAISDSKRQQLDETTALLHHALAASTDDLAPFQQVLETVFESQPRQTLTVSVAWLRPLYESASNGHDWVTKTSSDDNVDSRLRHSTYLQHLQRITAPATESNCVVSTLSEATVFQDAKDIRRDELVVNGDVVSGTIGYAAVVDTLQQHIERVVDDQIRGDRASHIDDNDKGILTATTHVIAKQILNACNRTESGGSSFEILSHFLTNNSMDTVLIRPDSANAAPLAIDVDVGAFEQATGSTGSTSDTGHWAFGLRAKVSAVTSYLVCDAEDPTTELFAVKTTYVNRLAFPLGLTPFHPVDAMRKDCGVVQLELVQPPHATLSLPTSPMVKATGERRGSAVDELADLDDLL